MFPPSEFQRGGTVLGIMFHFLLAVARLSLSMFSNSGGGMFSAPSFVGGTGNYEQPKRRRLNARSVSLR